MISDKKLVAIGGGTGLSTVLGGLRKYFLTHKPLPNRLNICKRIFKKLKSRVQIARPMPRSLSLGILINHLLL